MTAETDRNQIVELKVGEPLTGRAFLWVKITAKDLPCSGSIIEMEKFLDWLGQLVVLKLVR